MKLLLLAAAVFCASGVTRASDTASEILALERQALDGWQKGDPGPLLATAAQDSTYLPAAVGKRIVGLPALKAMLDPYRGRPLFDSYEMVDPKVMATGDTAVLTYILVRHLGGATTRWNGTQVYQRTKEGWRVVHTHWSAEKDQ
jgi:hypothetical protein